MRLAVDNLADAVTIHDATGNLLYANEATARMMGMTLDEVLSAAPGAWTEHFAMYDENGRELPLEELPGRRVFFGETPDPLLVRSVARADGSWQWVRIKASPLLDSEGRVTAAVNVSEEVTEVKEAELGQRLLAEAGATLATSLDYEKTLQDVARLAVPGFADWCGVELVGPDGGLNQVAVAHLDPEKVALGRRMRERYPPDLEAENGLGTVLNGETVFWPEIPDELLVERAQDEEHLELLRAVGLRSVLMTPLRFGDQVIGAMSFVLGDRTFSAADLRLAEELAARAVTAIENSRLYTERERIARTLQEGLLPPTLEAPPGWETAVLFRAAGSANEVGGDFYDIIQLGDSWLAFVGDVAGQGARAAALTARARYTMISVAQLTGRADAAVDRVNDAFLGHGRLVALHLGRAAPPRRRARGPGGDPLGRPPVALSRERGRRRDAPGHHGAAAGLRAQPALAPRRGRGGAGRGRRPVQRRRAGHHERRAPPLRRTPPGRRAALGAGQERGGAGGAPGSRPARLPGKRTARRRGRAGPAPGALSAVSRHLARGLPRAFEPPARRWR